jgi:hypothetical protein
MPKPGAPGIAASVAMFETWDDLKRERAAFDAVILDWAGRLDPEWLKGDLAWFSGSTGRELKQPGWLLVTTCSTTRPTTAARCTACSPRPA